MLDTLSDLVLRARAIPLQLEPLERLEALVSEVQAWKESAAKTFLLKNSSFTLLEVKSHRRSQMLLFVWKRFFFFSILT